jgi:predicted TIM-barrel fold metal-dependent hydrolase
VNFWFEELQPWHIDAVGADNILFETDFPHPTCLHGDQIERAIEVGLGRQSDEVREKILWRNAARLYGLAIGEGSP